MTLSPPTGDCPPTRLILRNDQSLGDAVMLTAAVRDLHRAYPGRFQTDVRTNWDELWTNNENVTGLDDSDPTVRLIDCSYPLVEYSNLLPYHFLHGFQHFLNRELRLAIRPTAFHGDIHLSEEEWGRPSLGERLYGGNLPY